MNELTGNEAAREAVLKAEALECLSGMLGALGEWIDVQLGTGERRDAAAKAKAMASAASASASGGALDEMHRGGGGDDDNATTSTVTPEDIEQLKASKMEYQQAVALFNKKPKKGVAMMQSLGRLGETPEEIAAFLRDSQGLDKTIIGDYLGEREEPMLSVMHAYVDAMDFTAQTLDEAIRKFLEGFRLPGESQKIDRLMEKFAERYCKQNPGAYKNADTAYVLSFSVIMLNTDAHNPQVKNKMTLEGFLRNNRGIDDGADVPAEHLTELYKRIVTNEIRMKDDDPAAIAAKAEANEKGSGSTMTRAMKDMSNRLGMDVLMSLVSGKKVVDIVDTAQIMEEVRNRARRENGGFQSASNPACVRPMLEVAWPAMLAVFSMSFEATEAPSVVQTSLLGFQRAIHLTAAMGMESTRDAFITPLAKLTSLHSPSNMRTKNVAAVRALVEVGVQDGDALGDAWRHVLQVVSRYDHLYSLAMGYDDASLFGEEKAADAGSNGDGSGGGAEGGGGKKRLFRRVGGGSNKAAKDAAAAKAKEARQSPAKPSPPPPPAAMSMPALPTMASMFGASAAAADESPFAHLKPKSKPSGAPAGVTPVKTSTTEGPGPTTAATGANAPGTPGSLPTTPAAGTDDETDPRLFLHELDIDPPPAHVLRELHPDELARVFQCTDQLDGEAIVAFARSLCEVSLEETAARHPRVFSLTKLVEISHLNMTRVRMTWSKMWPSLADFFTKSGCHHNLQVAMYVVDSLRQLAMKFLDRGELSNYSFQNDFLRPFVVVMRQSPNARVRELVIRCMSQMVLGRVGNIKSGWKSVFMCFTTAANDEESGIVTLAFETIELIIREHFQHITETDATTFTDCVNCLIAFTNGDCAPEVALNAIAFLRFCALKLADGSLGELDKPPTEPENEEEEEEDGSKPPTGGGGEGKKKQKTPPKSPERKPTPRAKGATCFTDDEVHVFFWFPLLAGLSELTFDPREDIRATSLKVLFDVLAFHGDHFSATFWRGCTTASSFRSSTASARSSGTTRRAPSPSPGQQTDQDRRTL